MNRATLPTRHLFNFRRPAVPLIAHLPLLVKDQKISGEADSSTPTHNAHAVGQTIGRVEDPNKMMVDAIVEAYAATSRERPHRRWPQHWLWSTVFGISLWLDDPPTTPAIALVVASVLLFLVSCLWMCCCRRCLRDGATASRTAVRKAKGD